LPAERAIGSNEPMRIAVFGDVHPNLPALTALIEDVSRIGADAMYCVGDVVGRGPHPNEVVDVMRLFEVPTVQGNWDEAAAMDRDSTGAAWSSLAAEEVGEASLRWTADTLTEENKAWLRRLPIHGRVNVDGRSLAFFHGSPVRQTEYLWSDRPSRVFSRIATEGGDDILFFGHTHEAHHRVVGGAHVLACGSVGCGTPEEATARYAVIYVGEPQISVGFRTVEYDIGSVLRDMEANGLRPELLLEPPARHATAHAALSA